MKYDIEEMRNKIFAHKSFPYVTAIVRGVLIYAVYALMSFLTVSLFGHYFKNNTEEYLTYPDVMLPIFQLVLLFLTLNTVILAFAIHHRAERQDFKKLHTVADYDPFQEQKKLLRSPLIWTEIGTVVGLFLLFPLYRTWDSLIRLIFLIPGAGAMSGFVQNLIMVLVFTASVLILSIRSRMDAGRLWLELPGQMIKHKIWKSMRLKEQQSYSYFRLCLRLAGYLFLYIFGSFAASYVIPIVISIARLFATFSVEGWFWWAVGTIAFLILLFAFRKRILLIRNLKRTCKKYGFRLFDARGMFLSLFHDGKRYTFGVEANGKTYYCRMLASIKRSNKMILDDEGFCTRVFALHIPTPMMARSGQYVQTLDRGNGDDRVFSHYDAKVSYTFETEGDGEKILILNPVPKRVSRRVDGHLAEADNGDRIGDYRIFTGNAFLRQLMRESDAYDEKHT